MGVTVELADGIPARIDHEGIVYDVNDTPTPLEQPDWHYAMTHPPAPLDGWRFQAVDGWGRARVFDVQRVGAGWRLLNVYD
jgi:hypothetical protein